VEQLNHQTGRNLKRGETYLVWLPKRCELALAIVVVAAEMYMPDFANQGVLTYFCAKSRLY